MSAKVGSVHGLWRFPVKGLVGERVAHLDVTARGVAGDHHFAVVGADGRIGSAKTTRRFRRMDGLLSMRSSWVDGEVVVTGAGWSGVAGSPAVDAYVSEVVGERVTLQTERDVRFLDESPVHIVTTSSLRWLGDRLPRAGVDPRRFRPNIVVETSGAGLVEDGWLGSDLLVGSARLRVTERAVRCVVVTLAQDDLAFAPGVLGELDDTTDRRFGVYADVVVAGSVAVGDDVRLA